LGIGLNLGNWNTRVFDPVEEKLGNAEGKKRRRGSLSIALRYACGSPTQQQGHAITAGSFSGRSRLLFEMSSEIGNARETDHARDRQRGCRVKLTSLRYSWARGHPQCEVAAGRVADRHNGVEV